MSEIESEKLMLSDVANTGLLTAFCHTIDSRSRKPVLEDPQAEAIADRLTPMLANSPTKLLGRVASLERPRA